MVQGSNCAIKDGGALFQLSSIMVLTLDSNSVAQVVGLLQYDGLLRVRWQWGLRAFVQVVKACYMGLEGVVRTPRPSQAFPTR